MVNERAIRITHSVLMGLTTLASIVALAISAALVSEYNKGGYPPVHTGAYRDRIRICLAAGIWSTFIGLGFQIMGTTAAFGVLTHLVAVAIGFILFIIGAGSLTALTTHVDCSKSGQTFDHCSVVKGLVVISWIDTIFLFLTLIFVIVLGFMARRFANMRSATLYAD